MSCDNSRQALGIRQPLMRRTLLPVLALAALAACGQPPRPDPDLAAEEVTPLIRAGTADAAGWARDVRDALRAAEIPVDREHVCQVLGILEQESGYEPDPAVPGLPDIIEAAIDEQLGMLGPLATVGRDALLDHVADGHEETFAERLRDVRTERDVDLLFREVVAFHEGRAPAVAKVARLLFPRLLERKNPIGTAGSMQVSVSWAQALGAREGLDAETVRDLLYTRRGGVHYGTARLFVHEAAYDAPIYRFADYNVGEYASRNAAFQRQLAAVTGLELAPDGDLLLYDDRGRPRRDDGETMRALLAWRVLFAPDLPEARLRADVRKEKQRDFEDTETWRRVRETWTAHTGEAPVYATIPDVQLEGPKITRDWTTRWFAERVDKRYRDCLQRGIDG